MEQVVKIIKELERTSSTNDKIAIIKRESNNETFKKVLKYTYSDNLQYGFSESKLRELLTTVKPLEATYKNGFDMLDILATSNINDALRSNVITFLLNQTEEIRELYIRILCKDLRVNISSKTINKAIPKLITVWDIQQAYPIDKYVDKIKKNEWIALSLKLNGIRSSLFNNEFRSRQNKVMNGLDHIKEDLIKLGIEDMFVDGEMIRNNIDNISDNENFRLTTSILNSDSNDKSDIQFVIFDIMKKIEFANGESDLSFKDRLKILQSLDRKIKELGLTNVRIAPTYYTGNFDKQILDELLTKVDSEGYEGLMLLRNTTYKCKRNSGILKCKVFKTVDLKIVGFEEGTGKLEGTLGSIIVEYKNNTVNVGSGYTDEERKDIWYNRDNLLGKIIEVKYKEESMDSKTGLYSLQFPTYVGLRRDKTEPSYN